MGHLVKINCVNSGSTVEVEMGTSLVELAHLMLLLTESRLYTTKSHFQPAIMTKRNFKNVLQNFLVALQSSV